MTRTAAAAGITGSRDFSHAPQSTRGDLAFDRAFGNEEARADQRFVADPLVARCIAVFANRRQQRIASQLWTVLVRRLNFTEASSQLLGILPEHCGFRRRRVHNVLRQNGRRRDQHTTAYGLELSLRYDVLIIDLQREPHVRPTDQRGCTTHKTRLVRIAHISWIKEMIGGYFG